MKQAKMKNQEEKDNKIKVLVVDDEPDIVDIFYTHLTKKGYNVDVVLSGKAATENAKKKKYDVTFLDLKMPGLDGAQTCQQLAKIDPNNKIILITGYGSEVDHMKKTAFKAGALKCIDKPFNLGRIVCAIEEAMKS